MMKKVLSFLLALVLVLGLCACGNKPGVETPTPPVTQSPAATDPVTNPPATPTPSTEVPPTSDPVISDPPATESPSAFVAPEGTVVCGIRLKGLTKEGALVTLRTSAETLAFTLDVNGKAIAFTGLNVGLTVNEEQFAAYWSALEQGTEYTETLFTLNRDTLEAAISKDLESAAKNPAVTYSKSQSKFIVTHGSSGMDYDVVTIANQAEAALCDLKTSCSVSAQGTVLNPTVSNSDSRLNTAAATANSYLSLNLAYVFTPDGTNSATETISVERLASFVSIDTNYTVTISRSAVDQYVSSLVNNYSDVARNGSFITTAGGTAPLEVKYYGRQVDGQALSEDIYSCLLNGVSGTREAAYVSGDRASLPYGGSYVEVDLTNQMLYVYKNGDQVVSTPIVSGCVANGDQTPTGVFSIYKKVEDCWLVGPTWYDHVDYWMAFYGSYGLHDASWRNEFGDQIYIYEGSHGCPNLPVEIAGQVYHNVTIGTPVIVHGGLSEPVNLTQAITGTDVYNLFETGYSFALDAVLKYEGAEVTYTSSNPTVATVSPEGVVTVHDSGTAYITVTAAPFTHHTGAGMTVKVNVFLSCYPEDHVFGNWIVTTPTSCHAPGVESHICTVCGTVETREIPALEHTYQLNEDGSEWTVVIAPVCPESGLESRTCTVCGTVETRVILASEHTYQLNEDGSEWTVITAPTCTEPGLGSRTCSICGFTEQQELPPTDHDFTGNQFYCHYGCGTVNPLFLTPGIPRY